MNIQSMLENSHDSSLSNISFIDCELDKVNFSTRLSLIQLAMSKIRHGGKISITGIDAIELANGLYKGFINIEEFNSMLRPSIVTCDTICHVLTGSKFKVLVSRINNYMYYIEAERL